MGMLDVKVENSRLVRFDKARAAAARARIRGHSRTPEGVAEILRFRAKAARQAAEKRTSERIDAAARQIRAAVCKIIDRCDFSEFDQSSETAWKPTKRRRHATWGRNDYNAVPRMQDIIRAIEAAIHVPRGDLVSSRKAAHVVRCRHIAMWIARRASAMSFPQIGRMLGGRDHSTIMHGVNKVQRNFVEFEADVIAVCRELEAAGKRVDAATMAGD